MLITLSEDVDDTEEIARIICDKKLIAQNNEIKVGAFLYKPIPTEISVNRISTLDNQARHDLGKKHQEKNQPDRTYYGYAQIQVKICRDLGCDVIKDDVGGTLPYHANIIYPTPQLKQTDFKIATKIALLCTFVPHS
jgi:hypothetical protein